MGVTKSHSTSRQRTQSATRLGGLDSPDSPDSPDGRRSRPDGTADAALAAARSALELIFGEPSGRSFAVRFWNEVVDLPGDDATPAFTLQLNDPGALRRMLLPPSEIRICESFIRGDFDIIGNVEAAAALAEGIRDRVSHPARVARLTRALLALPSTPPPGSIDGARRDPSGLPITRHTPARDAKAVRSHYDVGNDFYALWLDKRMVYSCAYFTRADADIDTAQEEKLDHICRKLRLRPGDTLLDVGCGWGGLVMHAAQSYGVRAVGITLSYEQAALARERIHARGLADSCTVEVRDYRHLPPDQSFDKIVSVGMVEHVGRHKLPTYFERLFSLLGPGGLLLNHGIVHSPEREAPSLARRIGGRLWGENAFINRYVFPDGELPTLAEVIDTAETAGFETRDVESLREHYALTLRHWVDRLERSSDAAIASAGEPIYRIWRLYMAASAYGFASGRLGLDQVLLAKPDGSGRAHIPLTRADIYAA